MRICLVVLVAAGCGRVAFDERSDAPPPPDAAEHDEDRDGFGDSADNCPHVANNQDDVDADNVGDACDLSSATAEQIVLFEPFVDPTGWQISGPLTADGESLVADTRDDNDTRALHDFTFSGNERIIVGARFGQRDPVSRRQLYAAVHQTLVAYYYCELFELDATTKYGLVHTPDDFNYFTADSGTLLAPLENNDVWVEIGTPATSATCRTSWAVDRVLLAGATPAITPTQIGIYVQNVEIEIKWVVVIRTN